MARAFALLWMPSRYAAQDTIWKVTLRWPRGMSKRPPGWTFACVFVWIESGLMSSLKLHKLGGEALFIGRLLSWLFLLLVRNLPFSSILQARWPLVHQKEEALLFRVFRCDLPIENVCKGLWKPPTPPTRGVLTHVAINRTLQSPFLIGLRSTLGDWSKCVCESTMYIINKTLNLGVEETKHTMDLSHDNPELAWYCA